MQKWEWWLLLSIFGIILLYGVSLAIKQSGWSVRIIKQDQLQKENRQKLIKDKLKKGTLFRFINTESDLTNRTHLFPIEITFFTKFPQTWKMIHFLHFYYPDWKEMYEIAPSVLKNPIKKLNIVKFKVKYQALKIILATKCDWKELQLITKEKKEVFNQKLCFFLRKKRKLNYEDFKNWAGKTIKNKNAIFKRLQKQMVFA